MRFLPGEETNKDRILFRSTKKEKTDREVVFLHFQYYFLSFQERDENIFVKIAKILIPGNLNYKAYYVWALKRRMSTCQHVVIVSYMILLNKDEMMLLLEEVVIATRSLRPS